MISDEVEELGEEYESGKSNDTESIREGNNVFKNRLKIKK